MHICVCNLTIIGSDNGLSPGQRQAIIWTNAIILLIRTLGTNFSEILSEIQTFSFKKTNLKISSGKWRPFCLGLKVLTRWLPTYRWDKYNLYTGIQSITSACSFFFVTNRIFWSVHSTNILSLTHWPLGHVVPDLNFETHFKFCYLKHYLCNCPRWMPYNAITWTNVDWVPWCQMADHQEPVSSRPKRLYCQAVLFFFFFSNFVGNAALWS